MNYETLLDRIITDGIAEVRTEYANPKNHHQIEWVCNVISAGLDAPLLAHLPTACGAMKYAEIVGVQGHDGAAS
jgi:hypothetical protein